MGFVRSHFVSPLVALAVATTSIASAAAAAEAALVFQTDFALKDGAVAAMKGVAFGVSRTLPQFDLTHEIPPYHIWEGAYRLKQTVPFWPESTVFVSVVDPGVGTERKAVVAHLRSGHYIVTPDNGTLTFLAEEPGVAELREIDPARHRRPGSEASYTFHGRDLFALVGARLAAGAIAFADVGAPLTREAVTLPYQKPELRDGVLRGTLVVLDGPYGNVWSNIPQSLFARLAPAPTLGEPFAVQLFRGDERVFTGSVTYAASFGTVPEGEPLLYLNSLLELALALNQGNFAAAHNIAAGPECRLEIRRAAPSP